jgi:hypothetical protein
MTSFKLRIMAQVLPFLLVAPGIVLAQTPPSRAEASAALAQPASPGTALYTPQQLDQLVAPIALYPDELLSEVLMAAGYPQQIVEAAQWVQDPSHAAIKGDALVAALQPLPWDPSVKGLVVFPQLVVMLSEHIDWTQALGAAFASQQAEVMTRVQELRHLAVRSGRTKTLRHLVFREEGQEIVIAAAEPDRIFVPVYNPVVVYGAWPDHDYPPVYLPPPPNFIGERIAPGLEASVGYAIVAPLWGWSHPNWRDREITVNRTEYTRITRNVVIGSGDRWRHAGPVVLISPAAAPRPSRSTAAIPAGAVAPRRAAAVTVLPQRAAAHPEAIRIERAAGQPGAARTGEAAPTPAAPERGKTRAATTSPNAASPPPAAAAAPSREPAVGARQQEATKPAGMRPGEQREERKQATAPAGANPAAEKPPTEHAAPAAAAATPSTEHAAPATAAAKPPTEHAAPTAAAAKPPTEHAAHQPAPEIKSTEHAGAREPAHPAPGSAPPPQHAAQHPAPENHASGSTVPPHAAAPHPAPAEPHAVHEPAGKRPPGDEDKQGH